MIFAVTSYAIAFERRTEANLRDASPSAGLFRARGALLVEIRECSREVYSNCHACAQAGPFCVCRLISDVASHKYVDAALRSL